MLCYIVKFSSLKIESIWVIKINSIFLLGVISIGRTKIFYENKQFSITYRMLSNQLEYLGSYWGCSPQSHPVITLEYDMNGTKCYNVLATYQSDLVYLYDHTFVDYVLKLLEVRDDEAQAEALNQSMTLT